MSAILTFAGMRVACPHGMRWKGWGRKTPPGRVVDHCTLCSAPLHEGEESVRFFGVYVHVLCYYREVGLPDFGTRFWY